jgi:hypothetical protein
VEQNLSFARARCEEAGLTVAPQAGEPVPADAALAAPSAPAAPARPIPAPGHPAGAPAVFTAGGNVVATAGPSGTAEEFENRIPVPMTALDDKAHQFRGLAPALEPENA